MSASVNRKVALQLVGGIGVVSVPIAAWWYQARDARATLRETFTNRPLSLTPDTYDYLISDKCQPGDVVLFDRRCERCASSPWAALACLVAKQSLGGPCQYDHCGIVVPGYVKTKADQFDPTNLLLLEATPSGIVARPLKARLEQSASRSILLLQVCSPGENRRDGGESKSEATERALQFAQRELTKFRDQWLKASEKQGYQNFHSTVTLGGAVAYWIGLQDHISGPISPAAFMVLCGLQKAGIAVNINDRENRKTQVADFLRDYRLTDEHVVRLRPGYRFLPPITLKQGNAQL